MWSNKIKERFCKECNLPITIFDEPYFTNRLDLLEPFYRSRTKWEIFTRSYELSRFTSEQEYYEHYNAVKDEVINTIKSTDAYNRFNTKDFSVYEIKPKYKLPTTDIYKPINDGRRLISIDMREANFAALYHFDGSMFNYTPHWKPYFGKFTENYHLMNSKYLRQVILGNCNPKRHITYEKWLTFKLLTYLDEFFDTEMYLEYFSNDEIVLDGSSLDWNNIYKITNEFMEINMVEYRITEFILHSIKGTKGYYKEITNCSDYFNIIDYEFKCLEPYTIPSIIRMATGQPSNEEDLYFIAENGRLAKFIEPLDIKIPVLKEFKE